MSASVRLLGRMVASSRAASARAVTGKVSSAVMDRSAVTAPSRPGVPSSARSCAARQRSAGRAVVSVAIRWSTRANAARSSTVYPTSSVAAQHRVASRARSSSRRARSGAGPSVRRSATSALTRRSSEVRSSDATSRRKSKTPSSDVRVDLDDHVGGAVSITLRQGAVGNHAFCVVAHPVHHYRLGPANSTSARNAASASAAGKPLQCTRRLGKEPWRQLGQHRCRVDPLGGTELGSGEHVADGDLCLGDKGTIIQKLGLGHAHRDRRIVISQQNALDIEAHRSGQALDRGATFGRTRGGGDARWPGRTGHLRGSQCFQVGEPGSHGLLVCRCRMQIGGSPAQRGDRCLPVAPVEFHELVGGVATHADPLILVVEQCPVERNGVIAGGGVKSSPTHDHVRALLEAQVVVLGLALQLRDRLVEQV